MAAPMKKNVYKINKDRFNTDSAKISEKQRRTFIDSVRIYTKGGAGGQGIPKYGGVGGKGGDIIIRASPDASFQTILETNPKKRFNGGTGKNASKKVILAQPGEDQVILVPQGVCVKTDDGRVLGDLNEDGQECVAAHGGPGGSPENHYTGRKGEALSVTLDLKLIADIGLVGFPNAGKSTFLSAISRAKPKIADYAFTTLRPQIGVMGYPDQRQIKVADLPGLIEGAHVNFGMGHKFLKHVERTKILLFMIDINGFQLSKDYCHRTAFETILLLNKELELFNKDMLNKPAVLALNKIDTDEDGKLTDGIVELIKGLPGTLSEVDPSLHPETLIKFDEVYKVATMFDINMELMKNRLRRLLDIYAERARTDVIGEQQQVEEYYHKKKHNLGREHSRNKLV